MSLIVDGYNVIFSEHHWLPKYESRECERFREDLLNRIEVYHNLTDEDITVVFDGGEAGAHLARRQHHGGLIVIFSDPDSDADEEIKGLVRKSTNARDTHVVSDDNDIVRYVKRFRVRIWSTEEFLDKMEHAEDRRGEEEARSEPPYKFEGPAKHEVDDWVSEFGDLDESDFDE